MPNKIGTYDAGRGAKLPRLPYTAREAKADPTLLDWTEVFRGIPHFWGSKPTDLADSLRTRPCVRNGAPSGGAGVALDVRQLYAIAQRIDQLSRALVQAESISAGVHVLNADDLAEYERQQTLAEERALKTAVIVQDFDRDKAGVYNGQGDLVHAGSLDSADRFVLDEGYACGSKYRVDSYIDPVAPMPPTLPEWNDYYGSARIRRAAEKRGL